jgi:putative transposase
MMIPRIICLRQNEGETTMRRKVYNNYGKKAIEVPRFDLGSAPIDIVLSQDELKQLMHQGVDTFRDTLQLFVVKRMIEAEIETLCKGKRYKHNTDRENYRHGYQRSGHVAIGGKKVRLERARVVTKNGCRNVPINSYTTFQKGLDEKKLRSMLFGVSTRNYEMVLDAMTEGYGIKRSSVSRNFVNSTRNAIKELCERKLDAYYPIIYVDGYGVADETMMVAMGIDMEGVKTVLAIRQGGTENSEVIGSMFGDLALRGVNVSLPTLFVADGSKAIEAAITRNFPAAVLQRCQIHKQRNILAHVKDPERSKEIAGRLQDAWSTSNYEEAKGKLQALAIWADRINPDLAASIREGMDNTLTVVKLGVGALLMKSISNTNVIESLNSQFETFAQRVKKWQDGDMRKRWLCAAAIQAEMRMNRVRGYAAIPALVEAMYRLKEMEMPQTNFVKVA